MHLVFIKLVTPEVRAKHEHLVNKLASVTEVGSLNI
jgi:hypothetical protein